MVGLETFREMTGADGGGARLRFHVGRAFLPYPCARDGSSRAFGLAAAGPGRLNVFG